MQLNKHARAHQGHEAENAILLNRLLGLVLHVCLPQLLIRLLGIVSTAPPLFFPCPPTEFPYCIWEQ